MEKDPHNAGTSPAAHPTRRGPPEKGQLSWHLAGGLPYGTAGPARGPGKRTRSNPGTAPRSYSQESSRMGAMVHISLASLSLRCYFLVAVA